MWIHQVCQCTGLTKKAVEYYTQQGVVAPSVCENGYRDYGDQDVEVLKTVRILRKLDLGLSDIRAILADTTGTALHAAAVRKDLHQQREAKKQAILEDLSHGRSYTDIQPALETLENSQTITEKLLEAFPGFYGRFIGMHVARFLDEPIRTAEQREAFDTIVSFLDTVPAPDFPPEVEAYAIEGTRHIDTRQLSGILESAKRSIENPEQFLQDNKSMLEQYLAYKQSAAYRDSPAGRLTAIMQDFNRTSGYNDVFIPALRRLSPSYAAYYRQLERANDQLLAQYPEIDADHRPELQENCAGEP